MYIKYISGAIFGTVMGNRGGLLEYVDAYFRPGQMILGIYDRRTVSRQYALVYVL